VQYIDIIDATGPVRLHATAGSFRSMPHTAVGLVLLSRLANAQLGPLLRRINNEEPDPAYHVELARMRDTVAAVRREGFALSMGGVVAGAGALAMMLPEQIGVTPLAIGIGSVEPVLLANRERFVQLMRQAIHKHTGQQDAA
jgi:DNA-binding IclR family transcriptional regulator